MIDPGCLLLFRRLFSLKAMGYALVVFFFLVCPGLHAAKFTGEPEIQEEPFSPEDALAHFKVESGLQIEIAACEPLVTDPVEIAFDETGRMFVVETNGYNGLEDARPRSRIRILTDSDGDGRMDEFTIFADDLDYANGILPLNGGLLVTTHSDILFLRDTDGDGKADDREVVFYGTDARSIDAQIAAPRRALDNWVYLNCGLGEKTLRRPGADDEPFVVGKANFRYRPETGVTEAVTGIGQFGSTFDDWGRHFFCSNRNPAMLAVMPMKYIDRNPAAGLTEGYADVLPSGGDSKIYPIKLFRTTSSAHAGTHTAACGVSVYRGDHLGDSYAGNFFVCEPTAGIVRRGIPEGAGASLVARPAEDRKEFLATDDEWFKPVNTVTGPDGALYIVDMYRRFIDGARFFPDEYAAHNDMAAGRDRGRIYRIVRRDERPRRIEPLPEKPEALVKLLGHPNGWHRYSAQRLLVEAGDVAITEALIQQVMKSENAHLRLHTLWTLEGLGGLKGNHVMAALSDPDPGVIESGLRLAPRFLERDISTDTRLGDLDVSIARRVAELAWRNQDDRLHFLALLVAAEFHVDNSVPLLVRAGVDHADDSWVRAAILSAPANRSSAVLAALLQKGAFTGSPSNGRALLLKELASVSVKTGTLSDLAGIMEPLSDAPAGEDDQWWKIAVVNGLSEGLRRRSPGLEALPKTIAALVADPPVELRAHMDGVREVLATASRRMTDADRPLTERLTAIVMLGQLPWPDVKEIVPELLGPRQAAVVQRATIAALAKVNRALVSPLLYEQWSELGSAARPDAIQFLARDRLTFLRKIEQGVINPALVDALTRWTSLNSKSELIRALAEEIFGRNTGERAEVIERFENALAGLEGSPERGRDIFNANCAICHRFRGGGVDIGPDITDVRIKSPAMLLSDILDPNNAVDPRWEAHLLERKGGVPAVTGLVVSESAEVVTLKAPGIDETVPRSDLVNLKALGISLMPEGLEATLNEGQMADLISYLRSP